MFHVLYWKCALIEQKHNNYGCGAPAHIGASPIDRSITRGFNKSTVFKMAINSANNLGDFITYHHHLCAHVDSFGANAYGCALSPQLESLFRSKSSGSSGGALNHRTGSRWDEPSRWGERLRESEGADGNSITWGCKKMLCAHSAIIMPLNI